MLLFTQSIQYMAVNYWEIKVNSTAKNRNKDPSWVYNSLVTAAAFHWIQHWLYVLQYTKVSVIAPLTFCFQSERVERKRKIYSNILIAINIFVYSFIICVAIFQLVDKVVDDWFSEILWVTYSIALTIEFGRSLLKLHKFSEGLAKKGGLISNWKLMIAHFGALFMATIADSVSFII